MLICSTDSDQYAIFESKNRTFGTTETTFFTPKLAETKILEPLQHYFVGISRCTNSSYMVTYSLENEYSRGVVKLGTISPESTFYIYWHLRIMFQCIKQLMLTTGIKVKLMNKVHKY